MTNQYGRKPIWSRARYANTVTGVTIPIASFTLFYDPSFDLFRRASIHPRQDLLQVCKELLPPALGALVGLLLIRPEARLLHAQVGPRARRSESPGDDTLETIGRPRVRQRFVRLDGHDLTVDSAPVRAKIEPVVHHGLEIVLNQPLLDQVWLGERAPDLFRRIR